jgi:hypothetical protein
VPGAWQGVQAHKGLVLGRPTAILLGLLAFQIAFKFAAPDPSTHVTKVTRLRRQDHLD